MERVIHACACFAALVFLASGQVPGSAKPLTLHSANRAIDLGLQAELAGDYAGAEKALKALLDQAKTDREAAAKARVEKWLRGMAARKAAFKQHGRTPAGYSLAFSTLKGFGRRRSDPLWERAMLDIPDLSGRFQGLAKVTVRPHLTAGIKETRPLVQILAKQMAQHGVRVHKPGSNVRFEVKLNIDASQVDKSPRGNRVTAEASAVLRDLEAGHTAASVGRKRAETRARLAQARRFAVRRVLDEVGRGLVFQLRALALKEAAGPT